MDRGHHLSGIVRTFDTVLSFDLDIARQLGADRSRRLRHEFVPRRRRTRRPVLRLVGDLFSPSAGAPARR